MSVLIDVYRAPHMLAHHLFALLAERRPEESISHRAMPSFHEHVGFVLAKPYAAWYVVVTETGIVGAVYLSKQREIGISIFERFRGCGHATAAIRELISLHPGRFLANINPANEASIALFRKLGFGGPIQITLEKP